MKYWAYINNEIKGPFEKEELLKIEGFNNSTLVCPQSPVEEETKEWKEASNFPELAIGNDAVSSSSNQAPDALTLDVSLKKEDIMIERFSVNNLFTPSVDTGESKFLSTDPLSLSQIRRREEVVSQRIVPETSAQSNAVSGEKENKEDLNLEPSKTEESVLADINTRDTPFNIDLPDTDSILGSQTQEKESPSGDFLKSYDIPEIKEEPKEFKATTEEFKNETIEAKPVVEEFKEEIVQSSPSAKDFKIDTEESVGKEVFKKESPQPDLSVLKEDLMKELDKKISSLRENGVSKEEFDIFKEEIKKYVSERLATLPAVSNSEVVNHLDIEVRDLKARLEIIEKNISDMSKIKEQVLEKESLEPNKAKISDIKPAPDKTVVIKKEEIEKEKKTLDISKFLKPVIYLVLLILVIISVGFALKQFGIFDFTKLISKKDNFPKNVVSEPPKGPVDLNAVVSTQTPVEPSVQPSTNPPIAENTIQQSTISVSLPNHPQNRYDFIIDEVREYKINTDKNLENTISDIIKSRKGNPMAMSWFCEEIDTGYSITVKGTAQNKEIIFKFEYDPKNKILKPLNTLSINTLKIMMGDSKTDKPKRTNKTVAKHQQKNTSTSNQTSKEQGNLKTEKPEEKKVDNEEKEEEYLIIGE
ncbi:MAG: hypothetical protein AB1602_01185 [Elusimicrobiota bacterium]